VRRRSGAMRLVLVAGVALVAVVAVGYALLLSTAPPADPPPLAAPIDPKLPDLTVGPLSEITGALKDDGTRSVRFGVMIVNQGEGDFLLRARRSNALADDWQVTQRIADEGGYTERPSPATLVYGGDGHDHWHIKEVERHVIEDLDGNVLGSVVKSGFCFFDTDAVSPDLPGAPAAKVYSSEDCGGRFDSANLMGLSVGWGDEYPWHLFEQEIDITDLPEGRYRLRATADPYGWFDELDETNNEVVVDIQLEFEGEQPVVTVLSEP
jgi:lysyl oxidase